METSYRQEVVQSVHEQALVRPGLSGCLKDLYTGHLEGPQHLFPCCFETRASDRRVGCACCKTSDQLLQWQHSAFESVTAAPDYRATWVFESDRATRQRHLFFRRVGYGWRLTVQPFSQKPRTPTVAPLWQIGLHGVAEADLSEPPTTPPTGSYHRPARPPLGRLLLAASPPFASKFPVTCTPPALLLPRTRLSPTRTPPTNRPSPT